MNQETYTIETTAGHTATVIITYPSPDQIRVTVTDSEREGEEGRGGLAGWND